LAFVGNEITGFVGTEIFMRLTWHNKLDLLTKSDYRATNSRPYRDNGGFRPFVGVQPPAFKSAICQQVQVASPSAGKRRVFSRLGRQVSLHQLSTTLVGAAISRPRAIGNGDSSNWRWQASKPVFAGLPKTAEMAESRQITVTGIDFNTG